MTVLSVLDQSPVPQGSTPAEALADTVALAQVVERLGYRRYWLAEHHNTASLAASAPEVLAACVAARTSSIRVGAGGVLLPYYSPLKVAEAWRTLEALFPGRIDLGIGRASGADEAGAAALGQGPGAPQDASYPDKLANLVGFLDDRLDPHDPLAEVRTMLDGPGVRAMPDGSGPPQVWVLGSSSDGSALAADMGLRFCFAHFISPGFGPQVVAAYRRRFRATRMCPVAVAAVAVSVVCAETDAEAQRLATSADIWRLHPEGAERGPLLSIEEAQAYPLGDLERLLLDQDRAKRVVGAPDRVRDHLEGLTGAYGVEELVVLTVCHDLRSRQRSYELLAAALGLEGTSPDGEGAPAV